MPASRGRSEKGGQSVSREELIAHVKTLSAATDLPLNADSERCYAEDTAGIAETVGLLNRPARPARGKRTTTPPTKSVDDVSVAAERVRRPPPRPRI